MPKAVTRPKAARMPREERRRILLDAGQEIAREMHARGALDPLAAITPTVVIERAGAIAAKAGDDAGFSKSMLYYLWGDGMEGYRRDLLLQLGTRTVDPGGLAAAVSDVL